MVGEKTQGGRRENAGRRGGKIEARQQMVCCNTTEVASMMVNDDNR